MTHTEDGGKQRSHTLSGMFIFSGLREQRRQRGLAFKRRAADSGRWLIALLALSCGAEGATRFTNPLQPWTSATRTVSLLRPAIAQPTDSGAPLGSLMSPDWRLSWDVAPTPGRVVVRLAVPVTSEKAPAAKATEVLQVGASRAHASVRRCLTYGMAGGTGHREKDRLINGVRYVVWTHSDAGMSQQISALDLRAVVDGVCYAVERFSYVAFAETRDPHSSLPQAIAAAQLDEALASLQLGRASADRLHAPPTANYPGTFAR
jgi:hypothetical protein